MPTNDPLPYDPEFLHFPNELIVAHYRGLDELGAEVSRNKKMKKFTKSLLPLVIRGSLIVYAARGIWSDMKYHNMKEKLLADNYVALVAADNALRFSAQYAKPVDIDDMPPGALHFLYQK